MLTTLKNTDGSSIIDDAVCQGNKGWLKCAYRKTFAEVITVPEIVCYQYPEPMLRKFTFVGDWGTIVSDQRSRLEPHCSFNNYRVVFIYRISAE